MSRKPTQQNERRDGEHNAYQFLCVDMFVEIKDADHDQQENRGERIDDAERGQFDVPHDEEPTKRRACVDDHANREMFPLHGFCFLSAQLNEIVADDAEEREEQREDDGIIHTMRVG